LVLFVIGNALASTPPVLGRAFTVFAALQLQRHERSEVQAFQKAVILLPEVLKVHHIVARSTISCGSRSRTSPLSKPSMPIA
jgi:hypothetical protein